MKKTLRIELDYKWVLARIDDAKYPVEVLKDRFVKGKIEKISESYLHLTLAVDENDRIVFFPLVIQYPFHFTCLDRIDVRITETVGECCIVHCIGILSREPAFGGTSQYFIVQIFIICIHELPANVSASAVGPARGIDPVVEFA